MREAVRPESVRIHVGSGERAYPVLVRRGLIEEFPALLAAHVDARRLAVIADEHVAPLYGAPLADRCRAAGLDATLLTFPAGESSKTRRAWSILTDEMLEAGLGRDACVVAVGGGVTTDLAGFVAATYMRGIPVVQVPTSYLAMLDASVGGKTGVDVHAGKNLVGAFHAPVAVVVDPDVLTTLPQSERAQGLVEAFKHGAILDVHYFGQLCTDVAPLLAAEPETARATVVRSIELKAGVVSEDELESGYRQILNFGHTVGHAVEAASGFAVGHGSAVAFGMVVEARIGERIGVTQIRTSERLRAALVPLLGGLPSEVDPARMLEFLRTDKKNRDGRIRCVLLTELGRVDEGRGWTHEVPEAIVVEAMEDCLASS